MTTADGEAQGLKRASKHPKNTTYGRQNPITERWNSESQLILWRSAWADIVNLHLERVGSAERVDHRSHAERRLDEQPTIHEGVAARAMEKKGIISDRCELSRQITMLTEEIEELRSEKENLLLDLGCADDAGVKAMQSEITAMEASLHKLDEQKDQYSAELDETLQQYKQLQCQANADSDEILHIAVTAASTRLQQVYGKRFDGQLLRDSLKEISQLADPCEAGSSVREQLRLASLRAEKEASYKHHSRETTPPAR